MFGLGLILRLSFPIYRWSDFVYTAATANWHLDERLEWDYIAALKEDDKQHLLKLNIS